MNVLLLTQEKGAYSLASANDKKSDTTEPAINNTRNKVNLKNLKTTGNRSCALIQYFCDMRGAHLKQVKIKDISVDHTDQKNPVLTGDHDFPKVDLATTHGVIQRTWDGGETESKGQQLISELEQLNIYSDNTAKSTALCSSKISTHHALNGAVSIPLSFSFQTPQALLNINHALIKIDEFQKTKAFDTNNNPSYLIKADHGTWGKGITFYKKCDVGTLKNDLTTNAFSPFVLQAYVKPTAFAGADKSKNISAHQRVVVGRDQKGDCHVFGGLHVQRNGSLVSNTHGTEGALHVSPLTDCSEAIQKDLFHAADLLELNQFGADVIVDDHDQHYILELNDGQGISGPQLEQQHIPEKYVDSFLERLKAAN